MPTCLRCFTLLLLLITCLVRAQTTLIHQQSYERLGLDNWSFSEFSNNSIAQVSGDSSVMGTPSFYGYSVHGDSVFAIRTSSNGKYGIDTLISDTLFITGYDSIQLQLNYGCIIGQNGTGLITYHWIMGGSPQARDTLCELPGTSNVNIGGSLDTTFSANLSTDTMQLVINSEIKGFVTFSIDNIRLFGQPSVLPLVWLSFGAEVYSDHVNLQWTTTQEMNVVDFWIERSYNGSQFERIDRIRPHGKTDINRYSYCDAKVNSSVHTKVYYRITQCDHDGRRSSSDVIALDLQQERVSVYPNPVAQVLNLFYPAEFNGTYHIYDHWGNTILSGKLHHKRTIIDVRPIKAGLYTLAVITSKGRQSFQFIRSP